MRQSFRKKQKTRKTVIIICIAIVLILIAVLLISKDGKKIFKTEFTNDEYILEYSGQTVLPNGIYIGGLSLGGMTKSNALEKLNTIYKEPKDVKVVVSCEGMEPVETSLNSLGITFGTEKAVDRAISLGLRGGVIQRYKTSKDLGVYGYRMDVDESLDREKVTAFVEGIAADFDIEAKNASMDYDGSKAIIKDGEKGKKINVSSTVGLILQDFQNITEGDKIEVSAVIDYSDPKITADMLTNSTDILGSFTTKYMKGYRTDRCTNVEVATRNVNGLVLMPGSTASTSDLMKSRTEANGYKMGTQYVNGALEDAIGGGVCQVASTLYNALILGEIEIDERNAHTLSVNYVEPSMDAAISEGQQDLVFSNNLEYPICIYGIADGTNVTFIVFGHEYRDSNRTVKYESIVDERTVSKTIEVDDYSLAAGEVSYEGDNHDAIRSHMDKVILENGVEVSRETIHYDYYKSSQLIKHIGRGGSGASTTAAVTTVAETTAATSTTAAATSSSTMNAN